MTTQTALQTEDISRSTLYSIGDAVIATNVDGRVTQMNPCAAALTGWTEEQAAGHPIEEVFHIINEDTREPVESPIARVLRSGIVVGLANHTLLVARDGTERPIIDNGAPIRDRDGNVVGVVLVFRDQTPARLEQKKLQHGSAMASAVAALSLRLLGSYGAEDDDAIHEALARVGDLTGADRSYVFLFDAGLGTMSNTHEVCAEGIEPQRDMLQSLPCDMFPWWMKKIAARERIHVPRVADLPPEASAERKILAEQSIQSVLVVPLAWDGRPSGFVGFDAVRQARVWTDEELLLLDTLANLLSLSFQRKLAARALDLERKQLLSLLHSIDEPVYVADTDSYEILFANRYLEELCGEPLVGQICYRALQGRTEPCPFCTNSDLRAKGQAPYRWEHHNPKLNADYHIIDRLIRWPDGRDVRFELAIDVTEAARAHDALAESEARYRLIASQMAEVVLVADDQLRITYVSPSVQRLFGYSVKEAMERQLDGVFTPESMMRLRQCFEQQLDPETAGPQSPATREFEVRRQDGSTLFVEATLSLFHEKLVQPMGFLLVLRDITERRALQAGLAQSDRLASMGMLAAGVAHEINNPLAYVLYNTETLVQDLPALTAATRRCLTVLRERLGPEVLDEVVGEDAELLTPSMLEDMVDRSSEALGGIHRIREITRGLGTFSRVEQADKTLVDVQQAMECAVNMAFNEIKYRARLVKDYGKVPAVQATEGKLAQVFLNLLINAAHAIRDGDVDGNQITIRTHFEEEKVVVEVQDTGEGIETENLTQIFDPFFSTKGLGAGAGLGLAICKSIVESFGGSIDVTSQRGEGSCFRVRLPTTHGRLEHPRTQRPATSAPPVRGRILVVDDEAAIRSTMDRLLRSDHDLVMAASGHEACAILEQDTKFDLILCDLMMPSMSGMDLHAWLAERDERLARQVVFVTGGAFTPRASEYLNSVENLRVDKPFDGTNLRKLVTELITASRSRQEADSR